LTLFVSILYLDEAFKTAENGSAIALVLNLNNYELII